VNTTRTSLAPQQHGGMTLRQLWAMLTPWPWLLTLGGISVLLGAVLELVPPLLIKQLVDAHLKLGRSEGLLWIAVLYLGATAAVQAMGFLTEYLTAIIAQGVLRRLRVRLFAHLQTLPLSYYDRTPWAIPSAAARRMWKPCQRSLPLRPPVGQWLPQAADRVARAGPQS